MAGAEQAVQSTALDVAVVPPAASPVVIFVPSPDAWRRRGAPGGLSLLERLLRQLRRGSLGPVTLLVPTGHAMPPASGPDPVEIVRVPAGVRDLPGALAAAVGCLPEAALAVAADRLVDPYVLAALADCRRTTFASTDGRQAEPVAWFRAADVRRYGAAVAGRAARLPLERVVRYRPELRGEAEPYVLAVDSPAARARGWRVLLDHVQKRTLDLPGRYFDAPFENALVRRLAPTDVTPNQVTLATLVVAIGVAILFAHGWLRTGVLCALVVGVLDGVDGKLARLKLEFSPLGELEHVADFFYENAWYLSLAAHLAGAAQWPALWWAGVLMVALDLSDSLLYLAVQRRTGRMLDEVTPFDARFRAVAGRRNVYVTIFVVGFFSGHAPAAFLAALAWAAVTVVVHAVRTAYELRRAPRPAAAGC